MKKPKKPPVKAKGSPAGGSGAGTGSGKRGVGPGKSRGIKTHHHHVVHHPGFKATGTSGGSAGGSGAGPAPHKKAKPPKKRQWSPGWDAECCVAEAVGRILGLSDSQVLELDAACDRTIAGTLVVAGRGGLPSGLAAPDGTAPLILGVALPQPHAVAVIDGVWWSWGEPFNPDDWPDLEVEEVWLCAG